MEPAHKFQSCARHGLTARLFLTAAFVLVQQGCDSPGIAIQVRVSCVRSFDSDGVALKDLKCDEIFVDLCLTVNLPGILVAAWSLRAVSGITSRRDLTSGV